MVYYSLTAGKAKPVGDAQSSVQQQEVVTKDFPRLAPRKGLFCVLGEEIQTCSAERKNNRNKTPSITKSCENAGFAGDNSDGDCKTSRTGIASFQQGVNLLFRMSGHITASQKSPSRAVSHSLKQPSAR